MRTILVIESHSELRRFITVLLIRAGHRGLAAASVVQAAVLLAGSRVDVVASDLARVVRAPGESLVCLRQEHPALEIVALSNAMDSTGYLRLAAVLGAPWRSARPFMSEGLLELIRPAGERNAMCTVSAYPARQRGLMFPQTGE